MSASNNNNPSFSLRESIMAVVDEESSNGDREFDEEFSFDDDVESSSFEEIYHQDLDLRFRVRKQGNHDNNGHDTENNPGATTGEEGQISDETTSASERNRQFSTVALVPTMPGSKDDDDDDDYDDYETDQKQDNMIAAAPVFKDQVLTLLSPHARPIESATRGASVSSLSTSAFRTAVHNNPPVANAVYIPSSVVADDVIVHTHPIQTTGRRRNDATSRGKMNGWSIALAVLLTGVFVVTVLCTTGNCSTTNNNENSLPTPPPTLSPTTTPFVAFSTRDELRAAVLDYVNTTTGESVNSDAATTYGYPIGSWDVSKITNFSYVLSNSGDAELGTTDFDIADLIKEFNEELNGWNVSSATTMAGMFDGAKAFNRDLSAWDVAKVTDMTKVFAAASAFNGDVSLWNVSNVNTMKSAFEHARAFNGDVSLWDVSRVTDMSGMFFYASAFNGDVSSWDVGKVSTMRSMFSIASVFNGDVSKWNVAKVTDMGSMFLLAPMFNGDVWFWNVSQVQDATSIFSATSFNRNICAWRLRLPTEAIVDNMFAGTTCPEETSPTLPGGPMCHDCGFTALQDTQELYEAVDEYTSAADPLLYSKAANTYGYPIGSWDVSRITDFDLVFDAVSRNTELGSFDEDLGDWDVSSATSMSRMFRSANAMNINVSSWNVSKVTDMSSMFFDSDFFNGNISAWDVGQVTSMRSMFHWAHNFHRNLCVWQTRLAPDVDMTDMFSRTSCPFAVSGSVVGPMCRSCD